MARSVKCKAPTSKNTINILHELFARFGLLETIVSDNAMQFSSKEFENFCKMLPVNYLKSAQYHPRSNELVENLSIYSKEQSKRQKGIEAEDDELQKFLSIYRITPNVNASRSKAPAELI